MKKKEDEENGFYQFMRLHKPTPKRVNTIMSQDRLQKFNSYQSMDGKSRERTGEKKFRVRPALSDAVERRSNSTKFKSLNEYFNQKFKT